MRRGLGWSPAALLALILIHGCSEESGPTGGVLSLGFAGSVADAGAVLLTISGGPVDSVEAPGFGIYSSRADANTLRLIITGAIGTGSIAQVHIPDSRSASLYLVSVQQVAAPATYALKDPASITASLSP
jgi:hypothetical protein